MPARRAAKAKMGKTGSRNKEDIGPARDGFRRVRYPERAHPFERWREGENNMERRRRKSNGKGERCASGVPSMEKINGGLRDLQKGRGKKRVEGPGKKLGQPNTPRPGLESREEVRA